MIGKITPSAGKNSKINMLNSSTQPTIPPKICSLTLDHLATLHDDQSIKTPWYNNPEEYYLRQEDKDFSIEQELQNIISTPLELNYKATTSTHLEKNAPHLTSHAPNKFHQFASLFNQKQSDQFSPSWPYDHKIDLKDTFKPIVFKPYKLSPSETDELKLFIDSNLKKGYIHKSESPMASPFFFVGKKDRKLWPCQDYKYLNDYTVKNAYPIPMISTIMDKLQGAKYFTKLNIQQGYNNILIQDRDQ